jgi:hypothetical protein
MLRLSLVLLATTLLPNPAFAMAPDVEQVLAAKVARCFSPPAGARGTVTVSFDLDQTGHVLGIPRVDGFTSPGVGKAAVHAVMMCEPYSLPALRFTDWQHARVGLSAG